MFQLREPFQSVARASTELNLLLVITINLPGGLVASSSKIFAQPFLRLAGPNRQTLHIWCHRCQQDRFRGRPLIYTNRDTFICFVSVD